MSDYCEVESSLLMSSTASSLALNKKNNYFPVILSLDFLYGLLKKKTFLWLFSCCLWYFYFLQFVFLFLISYMQHTCILSVDTEFYVQFRCIWNQFSHYFCIHFRQDLGGIFVLYKTCYSLLITINTWSDAFWIRWCWWALNASKRRMNSSILS